MMEWYHEFLIVKVSYCFASVFFGVVVVVVVWENAPSYLFLGKQTKFWAWKLGWNHFRFGLPQRLSPGRRLFLPAVLTPLPFAPRMMQAKLRLVL